MEEKRSKYDDQLILRKIQDLIKRVETRKKIGFTDFLDPRQQMLARNHFKSPYGITMDFYGGYDEAERKILAVVNEYNSFDKSIFPINLLRITWKSSHAISHRNILGSIMGTGIKRDKIGDIIQQNQEAFVCVHKDITDYLLLNMKSVGKVSVDLEQIDFVPQFKQNYKTINAVVASLRLDCILAAGFGTTRTKAVEAIKGLRVLLNWQLEISTSKDIKEKDVISWRGKGRIQLMDILGNTKKNRVNVVIKKYI